MKNERTSRLIEVIQQINPEADIHLLYKIHITNRKVFLHLQIMYAVFFMGILAIYILVSGIDGTVHSVFTPIVCILASTLFSIEAYRSRMISNQFTLDVSMK